MELKHRRFTLRALTLGPAFVMGAKWSFETKGGFRIGESTHLRRDRFSHGTGGHGLTAPRRTS